MKKFIFIVILIIIGIVIFPVKKSKLKQEPRPITSLDYGRLAEVIRDTTTNQLARRYQLSPFGYGGGIMEAVLSLSFDFQINKPLSLEEMRVLLINCEETLLGNVNSNKAIRPYLLQYPFSSSGGEIGIFSTVNKEELKITRRPVTATIWHGKISYSFIRPEADTSQRLTMNDYEDISETYEEARNKVIQEGKLESITPPPELQPHSSLTGLPEKMFYKSSERRREEYSGPSESREMQKVVDKFGEELAKKNDLVFHCVGSTTDNRNTWYSIIFHDFHRRTIDEGRSLAANLFEEFFSQLPNNLVIQKYIKHLTESKPYLHMGPDVLPEQVGFQITSWDEKMDRIQKPYLSQIVLDGGVFYYYETNPNTQELQLVFQESLAEAKAFLESQKNTK